MNGCESQVTDIFLVLLIATIAIHGIVYLVWRWVRAGCVQGRHERKIREGWYNCLAEEKESEAFWIIKRRCSKCGNLRVQKATKERNLGITLSRELPGLPGEVLQLYLRECRRRRGLELFHWAVERRVADPQSFFEAPTAKNQEGDQE